MFSAPARSSNVVVATALVLIAAIAGGIVSAWRPPARVQAVSSLADESFAACTAPVTGSMEGFFILDFETGDLSGGVLSPTTMKFAVAYRHNVLKDLGFQAGKVKNPVGAVGALRDRRRHRRDGGLRHSGAGAEPRAARRGQATGRKAVTSSSVPAAMPTASLGIVVNGEPHAAAAGSTLLDVLTALGMAGRPLAVELNEQVVPRARLGGCMLKAGDRLEIVSLVGGG